MTRAPRPRRLRSILIPLNLGVTAAMLIALIVGGPIVTLIAVPLVILAAASAVAVLSGR